MASVEMQDLLQIDPNRRLPFALAFGIEFTVNFTVYAFTDITAALQHLQGLQSLPHRDINISKQPQGFQAQTCLSSEGQTFQQNSMEELLFRHAILNSTKTKTVNICKVVTMQQLKHCHFGQCSETQ